MFKIILSEINSHMKQVRGPNPQGRVRNYIRAQNRIRKQQWAYHTASEIEELTSENLIQIQSSNIFILLGVGGVVF
jgi:hypothetical protein